MTGSAVPDRGPAIIALFWVESAIAILVVALRFYGRTLSSKLGKDDWTMLFTVVLFVILSGFTTYMAKQGGFRHLADLSTHEKITAVKWNWITQEWGISGLVAGKVSVALQLLRIIGPNNKHTRWVLYALITSLIAFSLVDCIITFAQCDPPRALWDSVPNAKCWNSSVQADYALFVGAWNVLADFTLALLPVGIVIKTSLSLKKRLATIALLGLGIVAGSFGIVKITLLSTLTARSDLTWETYPLYIWTSLEFWMIIICGSIPPIRPLITRIFGSGNQSSSTGYYDFSSSSKRSNPLGKMGASQGSQIPDGFSRMSHSEEYPDQELGRLDKYNANADSQVTRMATAVVADGRI
ncbi:hypothetical protein N7493_001936 [Penicillium malachiteum]|uniref:Rhodopsin domain-containing protein n=1 Tax=Penicillium malachiteum TaxID=1324776 RepID=A0AAD6N0T4_9EURO|nr:hypothetical protein N7493_001936 [Penicillium malachiteum]